VAGATAEPLLLRQNDRDELVGLTRSSSVGAGLAARARIVLLAAEGTPNVEIARLVGVSRPTVNAWRTRYAERGLPGLADEQRSGRRRSIDQRQIVAETLRPPPAGLGVTHWSSRLLADRLGTSHVTVAAAWKRYG
jgi:transposase